MKSFALVTLSVITGLCAAATPPPAADHADRNADRAAIEAVLATYTKAVSTKDQALFETLLLNRAIPFSYEPVNGHPIAGHGTENYDVFRQGVFAGPPFTQRFEKVHIQQEGGVADVTLVFVNTTPQSSQRGWKSMQLLRVEGAWKIASEFFTDYLPDR